MEEITFSPPTFSDLQNEIVEELPVEIYEELPVELNLPEGSSRVIGNEVPYELPEPLEELPHYVPALSSFGLLDGKYLIRY